MKIYVIRIEFIRQSGLTQIRPANRPQNHATEEMSRMETQAPTGVAEAGNVQREENMQQESTDSRSGSSMENVEEFVAPIDETNQSRCLASPITSTT